MRTRRISQPKTISQVVRPSNNNNHNNNNNNKLAYKNNNHNNKLAYENNNHNNKLAYENNNHNNNNHHKLAYKNNNDDKLAYENNNDNYNKPCIPLHTGYSAQFPAVDSLKAAGAGEYSARTGDSQAFQKAAGQLDKKVPSLLSLKIGAQVAVLS
jgi:hypothetical protein